MGTAAILMKIDTVVNGCLVEIREQSDVGGYVLRLVDVGIVSTRRLGIRA
jgi:hypothetical protein